MTQHNSLDNPLELMRILVREGKMDKVEEEFAICARDTICVDRELIGTNVRAPEWVHTRPPRSPSWQGRKVPLGSCSRTIRDKPSVNRDFIATHDRDVDQVHPRLHMCPTPRGRK